MSKVKIQGNASGTGVLTIAAPNTNTDRTITLPDATSTLATTADVPSSITDNGDATAITIDSSERVGIGAAPASGVAMTITKDGTGADMAGIRFIDSNSGNAQQIYNYQGNLYFRDATAGVTRIRVDSDGLKFNNDSAAANALNDYEEGTFTPTIDSSSYKGGTWSTIAGWYTKIGNTVTVWVGITGSGIYINNAQGYVPISGAPFSAYMPTTLNTYSGTWSADTVTKALSGAVYLNGTNFYLHSSNPSFNTSGANAIAFSVTYQTTA